MSCSEKEAGSITLPQQNVFRNLKNAKRFAIDIGGSLTKIAYYSTVSYKRALYSLDEKHESHSSDETHYEVQETDVEVARLHFIKFETKHIESCLSFIQKNLIWSPHFMKGKSIKATGGGAYKYTDVLTNTLGLMVDKEDEMECMIKGCNFVLRNIPDEVFEYRRHVNPEYKFHSVEPNMYPYLLVNIGSGVSVMMVESESSFERIGGSAMGGGTFWGLGSLLTKAKGFDELLQLAEEGDHRNVDMLVSDIYGGDYSGMGLPGDLIACSFGKAIHSSKDKNFNPARSGIRAPSLTTEEKKQPCTKKRKKEPVIKPSCQTGMGNAMLVDECIHLGKTLATIKSYGKNNFNLMLPSFFLLKKSLE